MSNVVEILVKAQDQTKDGFSQADKGATSFGDKMKKVNKVAVAASVGIGVGLLKVGKDSIETSRKIGDLDAKSSAVFEGSLGSVQAWAEENKKAFGTSAREVTGLASNFADLLKPMGFTADQAADMATKTLDLSGALSKWSGGQYEAAEVSEILSKAMLGERDQLKSLGISISQADVDARLMKKGQEELTGAAKQQATALATQELIMEKSTDAQTAWAEGGRDAALAEGALGTAMATTQETIAELLTPAIVKGTEALAEASDWATKNQGTVMALGAAVAGLAAGVLVANVAWKVYTATVKAVTLAKKALTIAQKGLNIAMRMNPIGLVVTAIAGLIAIVVVIEKRTGIFSKVWSKAWRAIQKGASKVFNWIKNNWPLLLAILTGPIGLAVLVIVKNKDKIVGAFRKVPGAVRSALSTLKATITAPFTQGKDAVVGIKDKIVAAFEKLPGGITGAFRGLGSAITSPFSAAFSAIKSMWNSTVGGFSFSIPGWVPKVGGNSWSIPNMAHGGIHGGMAVVGEAGRELVRLPQGSTVIPNGQTERMLGGSGGGGRTVIELRSSGSRVDDMLLELLRGAIRTRGGDVQLVLGRA